jgi:transcriptional regulator with XRE-family HTH domain
VVRPVGSSDTERLRALGMTIRECRIAKAWSQEELAHQAGLHRTYIGAVERGERNITVRNLWALADALDVTADALLQA